MANLLANADLWEDWDGGSPPFWWDGERYFLFSDSPFGTSIFNLALIASPVEGDFVAGDYDTLFAGGDDGDRNLVVLVDGAIAFDSGTLVTGEGGAFNVPLPAGSTVQIRIGDEFSPGSLYVTELTITPVAEPPPEPINYNCACEDDAPRQTLAQLRRRLMVRLGYAGMAITPAGMAELIDDFINSAQRVLYRDYTALRTMRFFKWTTVPGQRYYGIRQNEDQCSVKLDPLKLEWVGIKDAETWYPLRCGILPEFYTLTSFGLPTHYEVRQCIEIFPAPDREMTLYIKGEFEPIEMVEDEDQTTIDSELVFLRALADAKSHYGQQDAMRYDGMAQRYLKRLVSGSHHTRRYIPQGMPPPPRQQPRIKGSE